MAARGTKANPLTPEPFGVYAWMLVISMLAMGCTIYLICKELVDYYEWNSEQLWSIVSFWDWLFVD